MSVILNFHNVNDAFHWQVCHQIADESWYFTLGTIKIYKIDSAPKNTDAHLIAK